MAHEITAVLPQGRLRGASEGGVCRFSAIPYAEPPVGEGRFAAPRPAQWRGDRDATRVGPIAPQRPSRLREAMGDFDVPQSEDCLHLTVWTPAVDGRRRPVVLWLHGGAWQSGGVLPWYDGAKLAAEGDIVVVAVNYRLAALGWLPLPGATANVGLLDQELAVDWVHEHIAAFCGDASALTVMGQSAGASAICALLVRGARFSRTILQSAALGRGWRSAAQARSLADAFYVACGISTLKEARALPVEALLQAQSHPAVLKALADEGVGRSLFGPVLDGDVLPLDIDAALARAVSRADVLASYTRDEMTAFPGEGRNAASAARGEVLFGAPARAWARHAKEAGRPSWLARFDVGPSERFGACHCVELPFTFGNLDSFDGAPMLQGLPRAQAEALSRRVRAAWIAFIRGQAPGWQAAPFEQVFA